MVDVAAVEAVAVVVVVVNVVVLEESRDLSLSNLGLSKISFGFAYGLNSSCCAITLAKVGEGCKNYG